MPLLPPTNTARENRNLSGVTAPLTHLGVISATGVDAASFLQGQLTQDVLSLGQDEARLAAFCSAKGRMQASFIIFRPADRSDLLLLVCSADLLAATLKRLGMFVMRAKVSLRDASADFVLHGVAGAAVTRWMDATKMIAARAGKHWAKVTFDAQNGVFLPAASGVERLLWCAPAGTPAPAGDELALSAWQWLEVMAGIATVTAPVADAFVPQMLNYESVGGVNFKKGCYPGQEIVARSQFRGTIKRRTYIAYLPMAEPTIEGLAEPELPFIGQAIFDTADQLQPCGTVLAAAPSYRLNCPGFDLLVCLHTTAADASMQDDGFIFLAPFASEAGAEPQAAVQVPSNRDAALVLMPLPYPLLDDI